jgi:hypothetical protein
MSTRAEDAALPYAAPARESVRFDAGAKPILLSVISTEEEFDWSQPFERQATSVQSARRLHDVQKVFDEYSVRPAYLVDYPITTSNESASVLREIQASGRCEIGAHLHPWVSPPHEEEVSALNSFPGNLPADLEARTLRALTAAIEQSFGVRPRSYQAGRYGFGRGTAQLLESEGYEVDLSASPPFDFSSEGGPDYTRCPLDPFWFGNERRVLAVPITGSFVGFWPFSQARTYAWLQSPSMRWSHLAAVLARVGALERLRLSPEGFAQSDLRRLVRVLLARGVRVFVFSFHSPSLLPGCTPYVRDERESNQFLARCRDFYEFFLGELHGESLTPLELAQRARPRTLQPR